MDLTISRNINQIIERDSKDTTYKFALLRGVIDSIQEFSHFSKAKGDRVEMKIGVLVYYWLQYYYPIIGSDIFIPQKNAETENRNNLTFRAKFRKVTDYYRQRGGLSVFINDLKKGQIDKEISSTVIELVKSITGTIVKQPMCYIGKSVTSTRYGIFSKEKGKNGKLNASLDSMIAYCGSYSIPVSYYEVFEYQGGFISGRNSILMEWTNFTASRRGYAISSEYVLKELLQEPVDKRDVQFVDKLYRQKLKRENVYCVWSGKKLTTGTLNIDHILPFAVWKNNDLWNLIPVDQKVNNSKRDMIPSADFIGKRTDALLTSWMEVYESASGDFQKDVELGLLGSAEADIGKLLHASLASLKDKCTFLIEKRGMPAWEY